MTPWGEVLVNRRSAYCTAMLAAFFLAGCGRTEDAKNAASDPQPPVAPIDTAGGDPTTGELRKRLGANEQAEFRRIGGRVRIAELADSGISDLQGLAGLELWAVDARGLPISDLSPLKGMPLQDLFLEETKVHDLSPLTGMALKKIYLTRTPVSDLTPLAGMSLSELNLFGSQVTDLAALAEVSVETLWLRETKISDISVLTGKRLVSLDLEGTTVADLRALAGMKSLQRLNIARSDISDLTPLKGLTLTRLIFTPQRITKGLDAVREMKTLTELDVELRDSDRLTPEEFWKRYDAGQFTP